MPFKAKLSGGLEKDKGPKRLGDWVELIVLEGNMLSWRESMGIPRLGLAVAKLP